MNWKLKYSIILIFAILLFAPAIQTFKFIKLGIPSGSYELTSRPDLTIKSWFSAQYQEQFNKYIEDNIGFRNWFIRFRNEIDFRFFKLPHAHQVLVGQDGVLYQESYLRGHYGLDFVGQDVVDRKLDKYCFVEDTLAKRGIHLVLMIAPGKASFYPEYLPDAWIAKTKTTNNYEAYTEALNKRGIKYLDMSKYLRELKDTSRYLLFPKNSTHWSGYAVTLVADTMVKFIEQLTHYDLVDFSSSQGVVTESDLRFTDNDIAAGLNLMFDKTSWPVYYPIVTFGSDSAKTKPDILSVGDSYNQSFWGFYPYYSNLFGANSQFWYYNTAVTWPDSMYVKNISTEKLDTKKEIEQRKIILIVMTEPNLNDFAYSFIDQAYNIYCPEIQYEQRLEDYIHQVTTDTAIFRSLKEKAANRNVSPELMAFMDSKWIINITERTRDKLIHQIYTDTLLLRACNMASVKYGVNRNEIIERFATLGMK